MWNWPGRGTLLPAACCRLGVAGEAARVKGARWWRHSSGADPSSSPGPPGDDGFDQAPTGIVEDRRRGGHRPCAMRACERGMGFHVEREIASTFYLSELAGVHLVRSFALVQFLRFTYAGCPAPTGHYLRDAFAENAFMLSLRDNRPLLAFMRRIDEAVAALPPGGRRAAA